MKFNKIVEQGYNTLQKTNVTQQPNPTVNTQTNTQATANNQQQIDNTQTTQQTVPSIAEFQKALQTNDVDSVNKMFDTADDNVKNALNNLQYDPAQKKFVMMQPQGGLNV